MAPDEDRIAKGIKELTEHPEAPVVMGQIQVLLSEKRTALSLFRTGVVLLVFSISLFSAVIVLEDEFGAEHYALFLFALGLLVYSIALMLRSQRRIGQIDQRVKAVIAILPPLKNTIGDLLDG